jgi:osomolarity two-component system sensor histidine kinase NIK1
MTAVARGDLTQKIEIQVEGEMSTLKGILRLVQQQRMYLMIFARDG